MMMDDAVRDFLTEICAILKSADEEFRSFAASLERLEGFLPSEQEQQKFLAMIADEERHRVCLRIARHAATAVAFHMLVLFDERKELGETKAWPKLSLVMGDQETIPPSFLQELLGAAMQDLGMDTDEWW